jgi:hypothetical protein
MTTELGGYEMDGVMLDLGFDVNILLNKYWEVMGKWKLVWSPTFAWPINTRSTQ